MDKVWLKHYQPGVPAEINPDSYQSLNALFLEACKKYADKPSFYNFGSTITFAELETKSRSFAAYLHTKLQFKKGDRFAIMLPNILQYPVVLFGCLLAGVTVINVNPLYTTTELRHQLSDSGAKGIIVLENFASTLEKMLAQQDPALKPVVLQHIIVTSMGDAFSFPKKQLMNFIVRKIKHLVPAWQLPGHLRYEQAMCFGKNSPPTTVDINGEDIAFLQYTGGTTGLVKGAILTHRNMVANVLQANAWLSQLIKPGEEIIITALPLYHIFSLTANCLTFMMNGGLNVLITNPRDLRTFVKELKKFKFTTITGVNTLFNALLNKADFRQLDFSSLKLALGGGMAVQPAVAKRWQQVTTKPLLEAYGLTETAPAACINPMNITSYNGYIGLPISSTEVSIRDDAERELGFEETGELWIRGPQVMRGYWQQIEETSNVLTTDGWLRTGDIATINADGYVKIVDRKKDMIIVSGFNVYPADIEKVISGIDGVQEVAVVGIKHEVKGEFVKAFVVKSKSGLTAEMIIEQCQQYLTAYKVPKVIEFRKELPKSNVGKILRRELKQK